MVQFAGHAIEGTDPGEIIYFKRRLGLPYVEFPPGRPRLPSQRGLSSSTPDPRDGTSRSRPESREKRPSPVPFPWMRGGPSEP